jgi:hypothetical protein
MMGHGDSSQFRRLVTLRGRVLPAVVPGLLAGNHLLVEAGGQHIHGFRRGLDYAFIRAPR